MKSGTKILILFFALNLLSCKKNTEVNNTSTPFGKFDFSKIDKFRETKLKGQIINDYDSIFTPFQRRELWSVLYDYNVEKTRQIVVVTIDNIEPYSDIQKMATDLGNYWGVGAAEKDNGLIILLCKPCRKIGIATGTQTELILTDEICKNIIDQTIIPEFRNGEYYTGVKKGVTELIAKWN